MGWFDRLKEGLAKTRKAINTVAGPLGVDVQDVLQPQRIHTLEDLELALIGADVGRIATEEILEDVKNSGNKNLQEALMDAMILQYDLFLSVLGHDNKESVFRLHLVGYARLQS